MTNRRKFLGKLVAGTALASFAMLPHRAKAQRVDMSNVLLHHVYFWLKDPDNQKDRRKFEKAIRELIKVPTIKVSHLGVPASTEERDVVDHSYTYSLLVIFDSQADQDIYQEHPIHLEFVDKNSHLWEKVVVYDSTDIGKS
ncbi:MAG: Dabb family protein [Prolixibacteraceae bacterium]|nr:Dabb family protein [Prolixibacteraceae bacterium]